MSCEKCDEAQDSGMVAYFRWKNADVGMMGCNEHLKEIFDILRAAQKTV
jgi:hypothetical protein